MATGYTIDFTEAAGGSPSNRSFQLRPYTTNGTLGPNDDQLHPKATAAATSLLLFGKGAPDYGERMAENMVHMLEHFSSDEEPVRPVGGQVWFDRSGSVASPGSVANLRVYDAFKHNIVEDTTNVGNQYFGILPADSTEETALIARFNAIPRIRITNILTNAQEEYLIASVTSGTSPFGNTVTIRVAPTPAYSRSSGRPSGPSDWYVGGWEYVLQNNAPLHEDLDANSWTIENLKDPENPQDAATMAYVDTHILGGDATLLSSPSPNNNDIIVYNASATQWENRDGSTLFLSLSGGTVTGSIQLNNPGYGVPSNLYNGLVATKTYVDSVSTLISELSDIPDVVYSGSPATPAIGDLLQFDGANWTNVTDIILPGTLTLGGYPVATESYVDNQDTTTLNSAMSYTDTELANPANHPAAKYVTGGAYSPSAQTLTLFYNTTTGSPPVTEETVITGVALTTGTSDTIFHEIQAPSEPFMFNRTQGFLHYENAFRSSVAYPDYPTIQVSDALTQVNLLLGKLTAPKERMVFTTNGNPVVYSGPSFGSPPSVVITGSTFGSPYDVDNQANPAGDIDYRYLVGSNDLQVFVDGVKKYASFPGIRVVTGTTPASPGDDFGLWGGLKTGLNPATSYSFKINVNGAGEVEIGPITGVGNVETMGDVVDAINEFADANYFEPLYGGSPTPDDQYAFGAMLLAGELLFVSGIAGTGSTVTVSESGLGFTPLFGSMTGGVGSPASPSFVIDVTEAGTWDANYTPTDLGYKEIGRVNTTSRRFEFLPPYPTAGAVVEVIYGQEYLGSAIFIGGE